jgi:SHS2 domain-containing protein
VTGPAGHEYFEVEARVGVRAWGPDRATAFAEAARAALALIVEPAGIEDRESREVRAQAESPERLLVSFVNECLYVHEIEGFAVSAVHVAGCTDTMAHGLLRGEPIDDDRHRTGRVVKAAMYQGLSLVEDSAGTSVALVLDV